MSDQTKLLAPMPVHGNTYDPLWLTLWHEYEPVITALRQIPLVTDIETCGGEFGIRAHLTDGSHLWIGSEECLPIDSAALEGYHVRRAHHDIPTIDEPVYDSTEGGEQEKNGNNIVPLIQAVAAFVAERKLALPVVDLFQVQIYGVGAGHAATSADLTGPFTDRQAAVKEYGYVVEGFIEKGWERLHEQGGTDWPLTIWKLDGETATLFVGHLGQAIQMTPSTEGEEPAESKVPRCHCLIAHPEDQEQLGRVQSALENALNTDDARGVLIACLQLTQPCRARNKRVVG